jgi:hypothetical protein
MFTPSDLTARQRSTSYTSPLVSLSLLSAALLLLIVFLLTGVLQAQAPPPQDPSQFDMTGFIQSATLDANCVNDPLCGGTITVNNQVIRVPRNTILQMPASALTWQQLFATAPAPYGLGNPSATPPIPPQTGLAMRDTPGPIATYEAGVIGNRVGNTYIAGLIFLAQHSLQSSQGFINFIDYSTGTFEVGGTIGLQNTGQKLKINDPIGRFSRAWSPDPRFTIDDDNPTVRSETGYPMCIPRTAPSLIFGAAETDPLCPQANRPKDGASPSGYLMIFTMPASAVSDANPLGPNPRRFAPFEIGDYVTWSGVLQSDGTFAAWNVIGNVGLYTSPGDNPAYIAVEDVLLGVGGQTVAGAAEATGRTVFVGFTTDPSRAIQFYGLDVDPCTGAESERDWGSVAADPGPPTGAVMGRWRTRPTKDVITGPAAGAYVPATREMRVAFVGTAAQHTAAEKDFGNGLIAGQYTTPIAEYLFPENAGTGNPIVPNNFEDMPFLAVGSGPVDGEGTTSPIVGTLSPWPGAAAPLAPFCTSPTLPTANAGADQSVTSNAPVALNGAGSTEPNGNALTYLWTQLSGPPVVLTTNPASPVATFTAPSVQAGTAAKLVFQLVVRNGLGQVSAADTVNVTVNPVITDIVNISLVEFRTTKGRLTVDAGSTAQTAIPSAQLTMQAFDASGKPQGPPQLMPFIGGGIYEIILSTAPQPTTVKVTSDHGGSATSGITKLRQ